MPQKAPEPRNFELEVAKELELRAREHYTEGDTAVEKIAMFVCPIIVLVFLCLVALERMDLIHCPSDGFIKARLGPAPEGLRGVCYTGSVDPKV